MIAFIEKNVINEGNITKFSTLQDKYKQFQEEHDCLHIQGLKSKNLKRRLTNEFKEKLQYKAAKKGVCFVYCPDSSHLCEKDYSKEWTEFSQKQKLKDVSDILRMEICNMPSAFSKWPASEQEITTKNASIPTLLRFSLESLLYSSDKQIHRRNRIISSIAQDLIYNTTNSESKTAKHVELGLCTKIKTSFRKLITWLNRLGHSISYHDVNLVETHIVAILLQLLPIFRTI